MIITGFILYLSHPEFFTKDVFTDWLGNNESLVSAVYFTMICVRALFFIPSTVLLLLGIALYPQFPIYVISVNLIGILFGAFLLYTAAKYLTPDKIFSDKKQQKFEVIQHKMRKHGFWIVTIWSFIPIVPTDLICYVAGAVQMNKIKFYSAVLIGELVLVSVYVYTGSGILQLIN